MRRACLLALTLVAACGIDSNLFSPQGPEGTGGATSANASSSATTTSSAGGSTGASTSVSTGMGGAGPATTSGSGGSGGEPPSLPVDCAAIKKADPGANSGKYEIDVDGPGGIDPFDVRCEMEIDDGGWTRFHWIGEPYQTGDDPLGQALHECDVNDATCLGRIPQQAQPGQLLIKDVSDGDHAAWDLANNPVGAAIISAMRDHNQICELQSSSFMPYTNTSNEPYCGTGQEGGCDSFLYTDGSCGDAQNWQLEIDGDGYFCGAAFKVGATYRDGNFGEGCGDDDYGYLDQCDCQDEFGELYYR